MKKLYQSLLILFLISGIFLKVHAQLFQCYIDDRSCSFGDTATDSGQSGIDPTTGFPYINNCYNTKESQIVQKNKVFCVPSPSSGGTRLVCDKDGAAQANLTYQNILTKSGTFPDYVFTLNRTNTDYYCALCTDTNTLSVNCNVPHRLASSGGGGGGGSSSDTQCYFQSGLRTDSDGNECIFGTGNSTCYKTGTQFSKVYGAVSRNFFCSGENKQVNCPTNISNYADVFTNSEALIIKPGNGCTRGTDYNPPLTGLTICNQDHHQWLMYKLDAPPYLVAYTPEQEQEFQRNYVSCIKEQKSDQECLNRAFGSAGRTEVKKENIGRCYCEIPFNFNCLTGIFCSPVCTVRPASFTNVKAIKPVLVSSPLLVVRVLANVLFYLAAFLFIVNFIYQGLKFTRSAGKEEELKVAKEGLTNTIMGLVFVLLIGSLLSYIISILAGAGL